MSSPQLPSVASARPPNILVQYVQATRTFAITVWNALLVAVGIGPQAHGFVDALRNDVVVGWARDLVRSGHRLEICVYQGDRVVGTSVADLPRKDLTAAKIGDGRYGFQVRISTELLQSREEMLHVFAVTGRGRLLLQRGVIAPPAGARVVPAIAGLPTAGLLARVQGTMLHGWAYNPDQPNTPAQVDVYDDERYLGSAMADRERPTSTEFNLSGSARGFVLDLVQPVDTELCERLRARVAGTTFELGRAASFPWGASGAVPAEAASPRTLRRTLVSPPVARDVAALDGDDDVVAQPAVTEDISNGADPAFGLVLLAPDAQHKGVIASIKAWSAQTSATTSLMIAGRGAREEITDNLGDEITRSIVWLEGGGTREWSSFIEPLDFVVFASAGDVFDASMVAMLARLRGFPDVVAWSDPANSHAHEVLRSGDALRLESFLMRPPVTGFAVRKSALARYPGSLGADLEGGLLHGLRIWLAQQPELRWCAIEPPMRVMAGADGGADVDRSPYSRIAGSWVVRDPGQGGPVLMPQILPRRVSVGVWRGLDRDTVPALQALLEDVPGLAMQILVPTSGIPEKGDARLARVMALCERAKDRTISHKLVACPATQAACCSALLAAADEEYVVLIDGNVALPPGALPELLAWAAIEKTGAITTAVKDGGDQPVANAMNLSRDGMTIVPGEGGAIVDGMTPAVMVVANRKAVAVGGIDATNFPDAWFGLEFCLRLRQSGFHSIQLAHIAAVTRDTSGHSPFPSILPLQTRVLFRSANLLET